MPDNQDRPRPAIISVVPGMVIRWQPARYNRWEDLPIFHIKVMTGVERQWWTERFQQAADDQNKETNILLKRKIGDKVLDEQMINFVALIENVPTSGGSTKVRVTAKSDQGILDFIHTLPADDQLALDRAIWHISTLEVGMVKNSNGSPNSQATTKDEPTITAQPAESEPTEPPSSASNGDAIS